MPRLARRPQDTTPVVLRQHDGRLDGLELRKGLAPSTTLPTNPVVGQRHAVPHATGVWEVAWSGSAWQYVGGSDLVGYTNGEASSASTAYPALPQGPTVTLPRGGVFDIYLEARCRHSHTAAAFVGFAVQVGAAVQSEERAPVLAAGVQVIQASWPMNTGGTTTGIPLAAAAVVGFAFRSPNAGITAFYAWRQIRVRPRTLS